MMKKLWIISLSVLALGLIISIAVLAVYGFNLRKMSKTASVSEEYTVSESFTDIVIEEFAGFHDVTINKSQTENTEIKLTSDEKIKFSYEVKNGKLTLTLADERVFFEKFFDFTDAKLTVSLPEAQYGNIEIDTASGDVRISGIKAERANIDTASGDVFFRTSELSALEVSTASGEVTLDALKISGNTAINTASGDIEISGLNIIGKTAISTVSGETDIENSLFGYANLESGSGDISLGRVTLSGKLVLESVSGDVEFSRLDASEIYIDTTSGDVDGTLVRAMNFKVDSTSGTVRTPSSDHNGGICEINTTSGDIEISLARNFDDDD